jgi:RHH-type rel operon transcriptional repressor/antitoxin RelB
MRATALRLPNDLLHDLETVSRQLQRTKSYVIRKAIETYVHEYADYQIALDRLHDKDDETLSLREMRGLVERKHKI